MRSATCLRFNFDFVIEHPGHALDDGKAKTQSTRDPGTLIEPMKFNENVAPLGLRNANAGIVDIDAQIIALPPAADQHASLLRVLDRIRHEVLDQAAQ